MPANLVKAYASKTGKPIDEVEGIWADAKAEAAKHFKNEGSEFWAYVNKIVRLKLKLDESLTFKDYFDSIHHDKT